MINKVDNGYKPAFGTSVTKINKINANKFQKLLIQHKDVAPVLAGIEQGIKTLRANQKLDHLDVKFKVIKDWMNTHIMMDCKLRSPEKASGMRKTVSFNDFDLLVYDGTTGSVSFSKNLFRRALDTGDFSDSEKTLATIVYYEKEPLVVAKSKMNITEVRKQAKAKEKQFVNDYSKRLIPDLYNELNKSSNNIVKVKEPKPIYRANQDLHDVFPKIDEAFNEIRKLQDGGLLKADYTMEKNRQDEKLTSMVLNLDLYSATLNKWHRRIHQRSSALSIHLCDFDKNMKVVNQDGCYGIKAAIKGTYTRLKELVDMEIAARESKNR